MQIFDVLNENKREQTVVKWPIYACENSFYDVRFASNTFALESCVGMQKQINNFIKH